MIKQKLGAEHKKILFEYGLDSVDNADMCLIRYASSEYILQQGYSCPYILIMLEGRIKVFVTMPNGRTLLIRYYSKRGILGDLEFAMNRDVAASSLQAITDVVCIGIDWTRYQNQLKNNLKFMNAINSTLAQKLFDFNKSSAFTILHSLETRLCAYIANTNINGYFRETLTEIAQILGTSYRHLLRTLDNLCRKGVLEKTPQGYWIRDAQELKRLGDDNS